MTLHKRPVVEQRINLASELQTHHQNQAKAAQAAEEFVGDLIHASEINTQAFIRTYHQLTSIYHSFLQLHATGNLPPKHVDSLILHLQHHITMETKNTTNRQSLLAVEADYDDEYNFHADLASDLEVRLLVLLCFRDELLLRDQGCTATPLHDININI